nr:pre-toxin TG domain-containing protein [Metabacillus idriensis]
MKKDIENSSKEYLSFKNDQAEARKQAKIAEELENRPWYEKLWDTTKTFTGEVSGYYDYKRATEGVDPVTGEKLTDAQRIAAGAMAAAGFIPVVGWAGRAAKGGSAVYKTVKAYNAADHALYAYKTSKSFNTLQKTEMGIYGLVSANGLGEAVLGKDMFGNELTSEQRQNSMLQALGILGVGGAAYGLDKLAAKNGGLLNGPYSNNFVNKQIENGNAILTDIGRRVGNFQVPVRIKSEAIVTNTGVSMNVFNVETKALRDVMMQANSAKIKEKDINVFEYNNIRNYRNIDINKIPIKYRADPRLVTEMDFKGKGKSGANAAGWERNAAKHFNQLLDQIPEAWSDTNIERIENGLVPIVDERFVEHFDQYKECIGDKLIHHHIGGGGQAAAVPSSLHRGFGGIHNIEKELLIRDNDPLTNIGQTFTSDVNRIHKIKLEE